MNSSFSVVDAKHTSCQPAECMRVAANLKMKLYLGLTESSPPDQTRIFVEVDGKLVDLSLADAAYLAQVQGEEANAYELAAYYFPSTIAGILERDEQARKALEQCRNVLWKIESCQLVLIDVFPSDLL